MEKLERKGVVFLRYEGNEKKSKSSDNDTSSFLCLFLFVLHYVPRFLLGYRHL